VVVDVVTEYSAQLHEELCDLPRTPSGLAWHAATDLSAIAYRTIGKPKQ